MIDLVKVIHSKWIRKLTPDQKLICIYRIMFPEASQKRISDLTGFHVSVIGRNMVNYPDLQNGGD